MSGIVLDAGEKQKTPHACAQSRPTVKNAIVLFVLQEASEITRLEGMALLSVSPQAFLGPLPEPSFQSPLYFAVYILVSAHPKPLSCSGKLL